jgi:hypothetical protein
MGVFVPSGFKVQHAAAVSTVGNGRNTNRGRSKITAIRVPIHGRSGRQVTILKQLLAVPGLMPLIEKEELAGLPVRQDPGVPKERSFE